MQNEDREQKQRDEQESVKPAGDQPEAGSAIEANESDEGGSSDPNDTGANPPIIISG